MQLTVPVDARFRTIVVAMARRVAESVGFSGPEAASLGAELAGGTNAAVRQAAAGVTTPLHVTFEISGPAGRALRVSARCGEAAFEVSRKLPGA